MSLQTQPFYEFGPFRLEPSERLLLRAGEPVSLPPKVFDTLFLLVRNGGHVLTKDELMKTLWPDTFVEENNLTQHISLLRRALGEGSNGQRYIETVPRLGYRFVVPVREVSGNADAELLLQRHTWTHISLHEEEEISDADAIKRHAANSQRLWILRWLSGLQSGRQKWIAVSFSVAAMAVAASYFAIIQTKRLSSPAVQLRTLAVLPFRNLKPDAESDFLSVALADAIIHRLEYVNEILVRPSSYVVKYGHGTADPRVIAHDLQVQSILSGSYIREGDHLRVSAELVEVGKTQVLWHEAFDLPYDQLLTIQDRVAENVTRGLRLSILPQEAERLKKSAPKNALAYEYFLRAQTYGLPNDYRLTIQVLEKSLSLAPDYAPAWRDLGNAYAGYAMWQGGGPEFLAKSSAAFDKALRLDPDLPYVRTLMAIQMMELGELDQSVLALREELRVNPNQPPAHWWLTEAYLYGGMLQESIAEGENALRLDPLVNVGSTFNSYLHVGDYDKFLSTMPMGESARTSFYRGLCYFYMKDFSRAASEFERASLLDPSLLHAKYGRALLFAIHQQPAEGLNYLNEVNQKTPTVDGEMLYKLGQVYTVLGDKSSAYRFLREAIDHNFYCYACFAHDPLLVSLHGEVQYAELINLARERHEIFKRKYF
jgi:DNA-binding winged helix-turn-helix (wHTH) protein/TolB-like protein